MTLDTRLSTAWAQLERIPITPPDPHHALRRRRRARRILGLVGVVGAVVLVSAAFNPEASERTVRIAPAEAPATEHRLLQAPDLGPGWEENDQAASGPAPPCSLPPLVPANAEVRRDFVRLTDLSMLAQIVRPHRAAAAARLDFDAIVSAVADCSVFTSRSQSGELTEGTASPLRLDLAADESYAASADLVTTDESGRQTTATATFVVLREDRFVSLLVSAAFAPAHFERAEFRRVADVAAKRLGPAG